MGPGRGTAGIILLCIVFIYNIIEIQAHPQCLDFRSPFKPTTSLNFCTAYSELGCCGRQTDERVKREYDEIKSEVRASDWNQCKDYIKTILCQRCSPYAAHIFDAESDGKPKLFPGLSTDYCGAFYDTCHQIVWFLDPMLAAVTVLGSKNRFCSKVSLPDQDYSYPDVLTNFDPLAINTPSASAGSGSTPGCLCLKEIKGGLANPLYARPAWDGSGRVFVAEQVGRVHIYDTINNTWKGLFLDYTSKAFVSFFPGDERGFLGMAFHPQYKTNGRFFIFYSMKLEKGDTIPPELKSYSVESKVRVSEMKVKQDDPDKADISSEKILLELFQPFANHNGGELFFGTDGYLYTFHGDGGGGGDPLNAGQNKAMLYGKVLRLDVDSDPSKPYTVPADNPFVGDSEARPEVYAYGVRNIWRCGIDRGDKQTGESKGILCGDVGQGKYEEIDILKKGANYGWNGKEGFECFNNDICAHMGGDEVLPITAYNHSVGKSICGGVFYRGCESPSLDGQYIYGDYDSRRLFSLTESNGTWTNKEVQLCGRDLCQGNLLSEVNGKIMSFGEDESGEIYVLTSPRAFSHIKTGSMLKFVDPVSRNDPDLCTSNPDVDSRAPLPQRRSIVKIGGGENEDREDGEQDRIDGEKDRIDGEKDRVDGEKDRVDGEKDRVDGEKDRVDGEKDRVDGEEDRVDGEEDRVDGEKDRVDGEEDRVDGEKDRVDGEKDRVDGEKDRVDGEKDRVDGEKDRVDGEKDRVDGEKDRVDVEKDRVDGEKDRVDGEKDRVDGEKDRVDGEKDRVDGEKDRVDGEEDRVDGEKDRVDGEKDRVDGEEDRVDGEKDRVDGEEDRVDGEEDRVDGEKDRVDGEKDRVGVEKDTE